VASHEKASMPWGTLRASSAVNGGWAKRGRWQAALLLITAVVGIAAG